MLTTKKQRRGCLAVFTACVTLALAGCGERGPDDLLQGESLIKEGKYPEAVQKLTAAVDRLPQNPQAWNHLGLAYHHSGQAQKAADAYNRAVRLDRNLAAARYNLGSLYLEQNHFSAAADEFHTYTRLAPKAVDGWVKLGSAQVREAMRLTGADKTRWLESARRSFDHANSLELTADAYNGLGLVEVYRNRARDAIKYFNAALQKQPGHAGAMLNTAIVYHAHLTERDPKQAVLNRRVALQKYREFLSTQPRSNRFKQIEEVARQLDQELSPGTAAVAPTAPVQTNPPPTVTAKPKETNQVPVTPKPEPTAPAPRTVAATTTSKPESPKPAPVTKRSEEPQPTKPVRPEPAKPEPAAPEPTETKSVAQPTPQPPVQPAPTPQVTQPTPTSSSGPRYRSQSPGQLATGNRNQALSLFNEGAKAQTEKNLSKAVAAFEKAVQADPSFFEAHFRLASLAYGSGDYASALRHYENALTVTPNSTAARYNFALTLQKAGYVQDAANELEKIVADNPADTRAHLSLGVLYDRQLRRKDRAREHYSKVLELQPQHPQALDIRYWLRENEKQ